MLGEGAVRGGGRGSGMREGDAGRGEAPDKNHLSWGCFWTRTFCHAGERAEDEKALWEREYWGLGGVRPEKEQAQRRSASWRGRKLARGAPGALRGKSLCKSTLFEGREGPGKDSLSPPKPDKNSLSWLRALL